MLEKRRLGKEMRCRQISIYLHLQMFLLFRWSSAMYSKLFMNKMFSIKHQYSQLEYGESISPSERYVKNRREEKHVLQNIIRSPNIQLIPAIHSILLGIQTIVEELVKSKYCTQSQTGFLGIRWKISLEWPKILYV